MPFKNEIIKKLQTPKRIIAQMCWLTLVIFFQKFMIFWLLNF